MPRFCLFLLVLTAACGLPADAEPTLQTPLALATAPPCSKRPGVRSIRSDLVQLGDVTASISAQASRESNSCIQNASLWVTQKGVSQQFELGDAAASRFAIVDVAPDGSAILLSSAPLRPAPAQDQDRLAVVSLPDGGLKWTSLSELLGSHNCYAVLEPQGFLDAKHIAVADIPRRAAQTRANCPASPVLYSIEIETHRAKVLNASGPARTARAISGPLQSCKSDPDVVRACYTTRARLGLKENGTGLLLWPLGSAHFMPVEDGMVPSSLRAEVSPTMRVYATMVICPLAAEQYGARSSICVDSATSFRADPVVPKQVRSAGR